MLRVSTGAFIFNLMRRKHCRKHRKQALPPVRTPRADVLWFSS